MYTFTKNSLNISALERDKFIKLAIDSMFTNFLQIYINKVFNGFAL